VFVRDVLRDRHALSSLRLPLSMTVDKPATAAE
jgi:hypothetical protein